MQIEIAKSDVWYIRALIDRALQQTWAGERHAISAGTKLIRRLNRALVDIEGHDCAGAEYAERARQAAVEQSDVSDD